MSSSHSTMLSITRSLSSRVLRSTEKASLKPSRMTSSKLNRVRLPVPRSLASYGSAPSSSMTKLTTFKYTTNPYLKIEKPAEGPYDSMDMIAQVPPIVVPGKTAACDGGDGPLGHPKVYVSLHLSTIEHAANCEYCGLRFISNEYLQKELKAGKDYKRGEHFLEPSDLPDWEYNAEGGNHSH